MPKPIDQDTARQAVYALLDMLDGEQDHDIEYKTGLPPARCAEIAALHSRLYTEYGADWLKSI
jgi:hypothetical protein